MAERKVNRISLALFFGCFGFGSWMAATSQLGLPPILLGAVVVALAHLVTVPAPSGERLYLGIGAATAVALLVHDGAALLGTLSLGMAFAYLILIAQRPFNMSGRSQYLGEVTALMAFANTVVVLRQLAGYDPTAHGLVLTAVATAGIVWFAVRAMARSIVALERVDLSARFLWLLALEDWAVIVSLFTAGALFGLAFPHMRWWAIPLALLPYAFSHLAFVRYNNTRITYGQTIRALAQIPEVAGLATPGHSERTAEVAVAIARDIGMHPDEVSELEYAALMHDIGRITLNEPAILRAGYTDEDLARWGAQIISEAPFLEKVGELVREQHRPYRSIGEERDETVPLASKIIKVASSYDQALHDQMLSPVDALELLHLGSTYDYDPDITASLRRVVGARGDLAGLK
jgi:HD-GYP domain-containing protein (c-di-GMP phosphodiesterase class II)